MTRFYEAPAWRFIVTDLETRTITFLDHLARNRTVTLTRGAPASIGGDVPSDNPQVNIQRLDGPYLDEGVRLIYGFRREGVVGTSVQPWRVRAAGIIMDVEDVADATSPRSRYTAYDPWQLLYRRPVITDTAGTLPPDDGETFLATSASDIVMEMLNRTYAASGDFGLNFGQHLNYTGVYETTDPISSINFARGSTIGEMFDALVETGTCDIRIDPVYDPWQQPGMVGQISVFERMGSFRTGAVFGWDSWPKNVVGLSRLIDGKKRANRITYYAGQGGFPAVEQSDAASIARYGEYFEQRFWPGQTKTAAVQEMAVAALVLVNQGEKVYTLEPASERAPVPINDYKIGDTVPIYASAQLRDPIEGDGLRVESMPLLIGDDMLERVNGLLVTAQEFF